LFISLTLVAFAGVFCFFSLGGCGKHGGSHETGKLRPCRLPGIEEELLCGKLTVFENRESRIGRTIDLNVVVLPTLDPDKKEEPLFDLAGAAQILRGTGTLTQQRTHLRENIIEDVVRKFDREAAVACAPIKAFDLITQHSTLHRQVGRQYDFERVAFDPARDRAK
jgi:hypothetical protein